MTEQVSNSPGPARPFGPVGRVGRISRRQAIGGAAGVAVGAPMLAACGGDDTDSGGKPKAGPVIATSEVPVGSAVIVEDASVVISQPSEGEFQVFSASCTHEGCALTKVIDGTADCPCHGSRFDIATGEVQQGPAEEPLPAVDFTVEGGEIVLA